VRDEILSHHEMCGREGRSLQQGMNFHVRPHYSILLMSTRAGAPYQDRWDEERGLLIYEGHDVPREDGGPDPKTVDQPLQYPSGRLTQNGRFFEAAKRAARGEAPPERVRVYEKLRAGIWSDKGMFLLIDAATEATEGRNVCLFHLRPIETEEENDTSGGDIELPHSRMIPTSVKVAVWARDRGQCVLCGDTKNLHFDHDLPFSKGGSSLTDANVRLLCAKHNLQKSDRIE
jgi:5-methylcytosine-specific restriction endonuclease McrA